MNCRVVILGAEGAGKVESFGHLSVDGDKFSLAYTIAGDNCLLEGNRRTLTQSRRGSLNTDATFSEGKRTAFILSGGELSGEIPIIPHSLEVDSKRGLKVKIDYDLGGAEIDLRLFAEYI